MVKDAAAGAAVGAVVAVPVPLIGPAIGAGVGVYKNLGRKHPAVAQSKTRTAAARDVYVELLKLDDLRQKGIVTDAEFEREKKKLLSDT